MVAEPLVQEALNAYDFGADVVNVEPYGSGHINDTFCVHTQTGRRFILQRMSRAAFKHPEQLMHNIVGVTEYLTQQILREGGDPARQTLQVLKTRAGKTYFTDSAGDAWRVYPFIEDTYCLQQADAPELFEASARAFGKFQHMLRDYPVAQLYETIPHFHDTEDRLQRLKTAIARNAANRVRECAAEIDFVMARQADCSVALQAQRDGILPLRVTHNDTKLNNVLMDKATGEGICVVDLDTTMPGLSINDFGDSIRFGANHSSEDEKDLGKVNFDISLFEAYTRGFLEGTSGSLTPAELEYLPWGARLMTLECGIRFLTDYLDGDHYFHTCYPEQNLDRCRTQFKLVQDMEKQFSDMQEIVQKYTGTKN